MPEPLCWVPPSESPSPIFLTPQPIPANLQHSSDQTAVSCLVPSPVFSTTAMASSSVGAPNIKLKAAAVHAAPVFMDKKATTAKVVRIIEDAGKQGIKLLGFPETFIPGYPVRAVSEIRSSFILGVPWLTAARARNTVLLRGLSPAPAGRSTGKVR